MNAYGLARIGRDVEVRFTQGGDAVANISLAFSWGKKGEGGRRQTIWVDGSLWGKRAEALAPYLLKGGLVAVTLEDVHIQTYQTRDGGEGHKLVGRVTGLDLAGGWEQSTEPRQAAQRQPYRQPERQQQREPQRQAPSTGFDDMDDDIPF